MKQCIYEVEDLQSQPVRFCDIPSLAYIQHKTLMITNLIAQSIFLPTLQNCTIETSNLV